MSNFDWMMMMRVKLNDLHWMMMELMMWKKMVMK